MLSVTADVLLGRARTQGAAGRDGIMGRGPVASVKRTFQSSKYPILFCRQQRARARRSGARAEERDRLWEIGKGVNPIWARYQRRTERALPVVILKPQ